MHNKILGFTLGAFFALIVLFTFTSKKPYVSITKAAGRNIECFFEKTNATFTAGELEVNIFCNTDEDVKILGVTSALQYPSDTIEVVDKGSDYANVACKANKFAFKTLLFADNTIKDLLRVGRVAQGTPESLPSGLFCAKTVAFKLKKTPASLPTPGVCTKDLDCVYNDSSVCQAPSGSSTSCIPKQIFGKCSAGSCVYPPLPPESPIALEISLADKSKWQIVALNQELELKIDQSRKLLVTNTSVTPIPPSLGSESDQIRCENSQGRWRGMPNNCEWRCPLNRSQQVCSQSISDGCLCPIGKCWDGSRCSGQSESLTPNPSGQPILTKTPDSAKAPSFKIEGAKFVEQGNFEFNILVDSLDNLISGFDALFTFESSQLAIVSLEPSAYMNTTSKKKTSEGYLGGVISNGNENRSGRGIIGKVVMKKLGTGNAVVRFMCRDGATNESNILDAKTGVIDIINCNHNDKLTVTNANTLVVERDNSGFGGGECQARVVYVVPNASGYKTPAGICPAGTYSKADFVCTKNPPTGVSLTLGDGIKCQQLADYKDSAEKICNKVNSCQANPPIGGSCLKHSEGDINCNSKCDLQDFELFRRAYVKSFSQGNTFANSKKDDLGSDIFTASTQNNPDVNGDGKVNLKDFNLWRNCYFKNSPATPLKTLVKDVSGQVVQQASGLYLLIEEKTEMDKMAICAENNTMWKITNENRIGSGLIGQVVVADLSCQSKGTSDFSITNTDALNIEIITVTTK